MGKASGEYLSRVKVSGGWRKAYHHQWTRIQALREVEKSFSRGALYILLRNPIYVGEIRHKGARYPGQHHPIVERSVWDKSQELLRLHTVRTDGKPSGATSSPLIGKLFDDQGERLTPSHAVKGNRRLNG